MDQFGSVKPIRFCSVWVSFGSTSDQFWTSFYIFGQIEQFSVAFLKIAVQHVTHAACASPIFGKTNNLNVN